MDETVRLHRSRGRGSALLCAALGAALIACSGDPLENVRALHEEQRHFESLEILEALLEQRPADPEVHYLYGVANVRVGRASAGIWSLRRAREFAGWELRAGVELARAGLESRDHRGAIEAANRVLEIESEQRPALDFRAEALARKGDFEEALADVTRLRELTPDDGEVELLGLRALIGLRRLDEAEALFADIETRLGDGEIEVPAARYCAAQAIFAAERGDSALAREKFGTCLEAHPVDPLLLEAALDFFDATHDFERGLEVLEQALDEEPRGVRIRKHLASRLRKMDRMEEAEQLLREGTLMEPPLVAAYNWGALAGHHFEAEDFDAAVLAWSRYVELVPEPGDEERFAFAEALALAGEYARALELARTLPEVHHHLLRGRVLLEQRRPRDALKALSSGIRLWPDNPVARYYAARAAERLGDFDRAISEYRDAIRADPAATDAGYRLARLHSAEGRYERARFALHHHLGDHPDDAEALLLHHRVNLRLGQRDLAQQALQRLASLPGQSGRALVAAAESLAAIQDDGAAADFLLARPGGLDAMRASEAAPLRSLVKHLGKAGRAEEGLAWAQSAVDQWPDVAVIHEIHGLALERSGRGRVAVEASHARALEMDPRHAESHRALARLAAAAGDLTAAEAAYTQSLASVAHGSLEEAEIGAEAAASLTSSGRHADARRLLEDLLWRHPFDARVIALLAERLGEEEPSAGPTLELRRRASRLGASPEAAAGS